MAFPVDIRYAREAETELGVTFPTSFAARTTAENGGEVSMLADDWQLHPFLDKCDRRRLARTSNCIVQEMAEARKWPRVPPAAVAIGSNGCGDKLILLPRHDLPTCLGPEVYWWNHETGDVQKVVDDFRQFA